MQCLAVSPSLQAGVSWTVRSIGSGTLFSHRRSQFGPRLGPRLFQFRFPRAHLQTKDECRMFIWGGRLETHGGAAA